MIKVYNKQSSFIIIGSKHIAPLKSETFPSRNPIIRALERKNLVRVVEIPPINVNPVTPELFGYKAENSRKEENKSVSDKEVSPAEIIANKTKEAEANVINAKQTRISKTRRNSKKGE